MMDRFLRSKSHMDQKMAQKKEEKEIHQQPQGPIYLPNFIACKIIELEVEISEGQSLSLDKVKQLLQQYSNAIQFFNEKGDQRHLLFQKKLQLFLQKPSICQILEGKAPEMKLKKEKKQEQLRKATLQGSTTVKKMIEKSNEEAEKGTELVKKEINKQQKELEQRIQRKRANSGRTPKSKATSASFTCPPKQDKAFQEQVIISEFISNKKIAF